MQSPRRRRDDDVANMDRRWFLAVVLVFVGSVGGLFGTWQLYQSTGPHPRMALLLRRVRSSAHRLFRVRLRW